MPWKGFDEPKKVETVLGRRYWYFELAGLGISPGDGISIPMATHSIPTMVTMTYFAIVADGVITTQPTLSRLPGAPANSLQRELEEEEPLVRIRNQQPACMVLDGKQIYFEPNVSSGPVDLQMNIVLAEGHDLRGQ